MSKWLSWVLWTALAIYQTQRGGCWNPEPIGQKHRWPGLVTGFWNWWGQTELITCGIWRSFQVDSVRIELSCRTPSWCLRVAWWCGNPSPPPQTYTLELGPEHLDHVGHPLCLSYILSSSLFGSRTVVQQTIEDVEWQHLVWAAARLSCFLPDFSVALWDGFQSPLSPSGAPKRTLDKWEDRSLTSFCLSSSQF